MDQRNFQFLAYGLITAWLVLMVYVITIILRERRLAQELRRLQQQLEQRK